MSSGYRIDCGYCFGLDCPNCCRPVDLSCCFVRQRSHRSSRRSVPDCLVCQLLSAGYYLGSPDCLFGFADCLADLAFPGCDHPVAVDLQAGLAFLALTDCLVRSVCLGRFGRPTFGQPTYRLHFLPRLLLTRFAVTFARTVIGPLFAPRILRIPFVRLILTLLTLARLRFLILARLVLLILVEQVVEFIKLLAILLGQIILVAIGGITFTLIGLPALLRITASLPLITLFTTRILLLILIALVTLLLVVRISLLLIVGITRCLLVFPSLILIAILRFSCAF